MKTSKLRLTVVEVILDGNRLVRHHERQKRGLPDLRKVLDLVKIGWRKRPRVLPTYPSNVSPGAGSGSRPSRAYWGYRPMSL
jgi:hypothetical protein